MSFRLILYLCILVLGSLIGYKGWFTKSLMDKMDRLQMLSLLFLLFIMGIRMGADDRVIKSFMKLGYQAVVLSIFSIGLSVLFVKLIRPLVVKDKDEKVINDES